ncbi:hypothetical protein KM043_014893 [Ampulex compressa]|nr:hypothetical protein KM043_014893 [Ampulex compressa]
MLSMKASSHEQDKQQGTAHSWVTISQRAREALTAKGSNWKERKKAGGGGRGRENSAWRRGRAARHEPRIIDEEGIASEDVRGHLPVAQMLAASRR